MVESRYMVPSKAPYGVLALFQNKLDGSMQMCVDYRALNKVTVRIAVRDEAKTTCATWYGSLEFLVMPFGLTNALATFCNLMNDVLYKFLDRFVVVYLDNIVIYNNSLEEHLQHLRKVLTKLREEQLYIKKGKCEFCRKEVKFLGHWVGQGKLKMDEGKIKAIMDWPIPTKVAELRSFLGLANYYRKFIKGYSKKVSTTFIDRVREQSLLDPEYKKLLEEARNEQRGIHEDMSCVPTRQDRKKARSRITTTPANPREAMVVNKHGLHSGISRSKRVSVHPGGSGSILQYFGLPEDILSYQDSKFTGRFSSQRNSVELLDVAQFCYSIQQSSTIGTRPAEIVLGRQPLTPYEVAKQKSQGVFLAAYQFARDRTELFELARDILKKASRRMKKYADKHRRDLEFFVGDQVLLKLTPQIWKKITDKRYHEGLVQKYDGPFEIVQKVGAVAYKTGYRAAVLHHFSCQFLEEVS
uniref:Reverse transcriptase domain-containing protein n=1 Tax=Cannabis sativa TaxID=3483 RepID=A0A803P659_CANSA